MPEEAIASFCVLVWLPFGATRSSTGAHALVDGNKRLGWLCTAVFLELNEASVAGASNDDVYELVVRVASTSVAVDDIAASLERLVREGST